MFPKGPYDVNEAGEGSEEPGVRRRFALQVLSFVSLQLAFTASYVASSDEIKGNFEESGLQCFQAMIGFIPPVLLVVMWPYARHGCLGVTCVILQTIYLGVTVSCQSAEDSTWNMLFAASFVAIMTLMAACISACTNFDVTKYRDFVSVFLVIGITCLLLLLLLNISTPNDKVIELILAIVGTLVFSVLLLYDVQTIIGGSVQAVKTDEMIYAMTQLYPAIVLNYMSLLMLKLL